jgi:phage terminase small subunit
MVGRKKIPAHMHIVKGTARPCRMNKKEPKAPNEAPSSAVELSPRASFWYGVIVGRIQGLGIASSVDSENVMLLAIRLAEIEECDKDIAANGRVLYVREVKTYRGEIIYDNQRKPVESVKPVSNPAVSQRSDAMRHTQSLLAEFGLSAAMRSKVSKLQPDVVPANSWEAFK